jgi:hypothetical protein
MDYETKVKLARSRDTPVEVLEELAADGYFFVRYDVAKKPKHTIRNPRTPGD